MVLQLTHHNDTATPIISDNVAYGIQPAYTLKS